MKTTHSNIEISYDEDKDCWRFELRGRARSAQSLAKAKEAIDKEPVEKRTQVFPRFDAYRFKYGRDAEIVGVTNVVDDQYRSGLYFWICNKDKSRSKEPASSLYPVNERNTAIVTEIKRISAQISVLEKAKATQHEKLVCAELPKELA